MVDKQRAQCPTCEDVPLERTGASAGSIGQFDKMDDPAPGKTSQQKVIVEHVTVAAGGQAIVGVVSGGRGSGGDDPR
jgi:hypothetical protein